MAGMNSWGTASNQNGTPGAGGGGGVAFAGSVSVGGGGGTYSVSLPPQNEFLYVTLFRRSRKGHLKRMAIPLPARPIYRDGELKYSARFHIGITGTEAFIIGAARRASDVPTQLLQLPPKAFLAGDVLTVNGQFKLGF